MDAISSLILFEILESRKMGHLRLHYKEKVKIFGASAGVNAEMFIHSDEFFKRVLLDGDIGLGESYMRGEWTTPDLAAVIKWFSANFKESESFVHWRRPLNRIRHLLRRNTRKQSKKNIEAHYDLGNDFYSLWLDKTMTYSSALFQAPDEALEAAQNNKYRSLCEMLKLKSGQRVLEIGCGWGGFATFAVKNYGVSVTGLTLSEEQAKYVRGLAQAQGLENKIEVLIEDYRLHQGQYDRVVSIEMIEAVGEDFLDIYFNKIEHFLKPDGLAAFQGILFPDKGYDFYRQSTDWIQKHIFPGGHLPSLGRISQSLRSTDLQFHELKDLGPSYAMTLRAWAQNFQGKWSEVNQLGFDEVFKRKWEFYLASCEALFDLKRITVAQWLLTRPGNSTLTRI